MIVVRDIFHLKFGKAKDAKTLLMEAKKNQREIRIQRYESAY